MSPCELLGDVTRWESAGVLSLLTLCSVWHSLSVRPFVIGRGWWVSLLVSPHMSLLSPGHGGMQVTEGQFHFLKPSGINGCQPENLITAVCSAQILPYRVLEAFSLYDIICWNGLKFQTPLAGLFWMLNWNIYGWDCRDMDIYIHPYIFFFFRSSGGELKPAHQHVLIPCSVIWD